MRLTEEKVLHISNLILNGLKAEGLVEFEDEIGARKEIRAAIIGYLKLEQDIDIKARARIASYRRSIPEGSGEWEVLYRKFFAQEMELAKAREKR
jgi:hypothetical protein